MIRVARLQDAPIMAAIDAAGSQTPWTLGQLEGALAQPGTHAWIEDTVGHLVSRIVLDEAELQQLTVHPAHRRRGHGRRLVEHALHSWQAAGVRAAFLEVREDNVSARRLYEEVGFRPAGRRTGYYRDGEDALVLKWSG